MKLKHVMWAITIIIGIVAMAAGVAVFVNKYLAKKGEVGYIECDCDVDEDGILEGEEA